MEAIRVVLVCLSGAMICAVLRAQKPEMALGAALATGVVALGMSLDGVREAVEALTELANGAGVGGDSAFLLARATGVALIAEFGCQLCRDAGESALAGRVELAGRVALIGMALPLARGLLLRVTELLP